MSRARDNSSSISIDRVRVDYTVPRDHPAPHRLREYFDRTLEKSTPVALEKMLTTWFDLHKDDVWLIQTLKCKMDLDADHERGVIARQWGEQIARELVHTIETPDTSDGVLHFPSWGAYLSRFLLDLTNGRAWGQWYYREFIGLKLLPISAAIRTAILDDPQTGLNALLELKSGERAQVIGKLTANDARRILKTLAGLESADDAEPNNLFAEVLTAAQEYSGCESFQANTPWQSALGFYLHVITKDLRYGGNALYKTALAVTTLDLNLNAPLLNAIDNGSLTDIYRLVGATNGERILPLLQRSSEERRTLVNILESKQNSVPSHFPTATDEPCHTDFGGLFLLFPFLDALNLDDAVEAWPDLDGVDKANLLRFLISAKCRGSAQATALFRDPLMRNLMGLPPQLDLCAITNWLKTIKRSQWRNLLIHLTKQRVLIDDTTWGVVKSKWNHHPIIVLTQSHRNYWTAILKYRPNQPIAALANDLVMFLPDGAEVKELVDETESAGCDNAKTERLISDLEFLRAPENLCPTQAADFALSIAAQNILRDFSYRLTGFSSSSLAYLQINFLNIRAKVEQESERRVVRLSRPPLHVILNMTSMTRTRYCLQWLGDLPVEIFPDDAQ